MKPVDEGRNSLINIFLCFIFIDFNFVNCRSKQYQLALMLPVLFFIHRERDMRNSILAQVLDQSARARCKCALRVFV